VRPYVEYGVLLNAGLVAPCASPQHAQAYAIGRRRTMVAREVPGGEWHTTLPLAPVPEIPADVRVKDQCSRPDHGTRARHQSLGEPLCVACKKWESNYRRELRARKKAARVDFIISGVAK
jgi:hypothetical protein